MAKELKLCPKCGSGKLSISMSTVLEVKSSIAECQHCGWSGTVEELLATPAKGLTPDRVAEAVAKDYLRQLALLAGKPIGLALVRSGVLAANSKDALARIIRVACLAAHTASLKEVEAIQEELKRERRNG